jgi:N-acyl-D-amino-acid deacylase
MINNYIKSTCLFIGLLMAILLTSACKNQNENDSDIVEALAKRPTSWLITNVSVIDGSGSAGFEASVRVKDGMITEVGLLNPLPGEAEVDGGGQVLAPGFIDTHSHAASDLFEMPAALPAVSQGITTIVAGQDGSSPFPLSDFVEQLKNQPAAVNVAVYAGHNTLRRQVLGDDFRREANADEIERMKVLLRQEMEAGAIGLSSGLEYDPGIYSSTFEVLEIAQVAADLGGRYISHMRSEDRYFEKALEEIIEIGRVTGMPVQISHFKLAMKRLWGNAPAFLAQLDAAREDGINISADIYPYEYWQSNLMVLLPGRDTKDRQEVELALTELAPPDGIWLTQFDPQPEYVGKTLTEIAELRKTDAATAFVQLIDESLAMEAETGQPSDAMIGTSMIQDDILALLKWPYTNVCTDGGLVDLHPRARGSFPRVLGRYVRELQALTLEQAVHKMTGLSADNMGISNRGLIRAGMVADMVLFDPATILDNATPKDSQALSTGITQVWVDGISVFENGDASNRYPGRFIQREDQ